MPPDAIAAMKRNAEIRASQVRALGAAAAQCAHRVVIAGDTNLPTLDPLLDEYLHGYRDGFAQAGIGFGYTFPTHRLVPWLRLDRVLTGPGLRVVRFYVGDGGASDHAPVSADIAAD
jgi:vancomycin resistance protein VanJ